MAEDPTRDDARGAAAELLNVVSQFPFATDSDQAAWLAAVLTPAGRYAFAGPSPLFLFLGNAAGVGKDELAKAAAVIGTGRMPMAGPYPTRMWYGRRDENPEELTKLITSVALRGAPCYLFSNLPTKYGFGCDVLDALLTTTEWNARRLGVNDLALVPMYTVWMASGNHVFPNPDADTARRVLPVRLQTTERSPEARRYTGPALHELVRLHRDRLFTAALTILAAYLRAGRPDQGLSPWGSYEGWSAVIRSAVVWAGLPDPAGTRDMPGGPAPPPDDLVSLLKVLAEVIPARESMTSAQILERLTTSGLLTALSFAKPTPLRIGRLLAGYEGQEANGLSIRSEQKNRDGSKLWTIRRAAPAVAVNNPGPVRNSSLL